MFRMRNSVLLMYIGAATIGLIRMASPASLPVNGIRLPTTTANPGSQQDENFSNPEIQSTSAPFGRAVPGKQKLKPKPKPINKNRNKQPPPPPVSSKSAKPKLLTIRKIVTSKSGSGVRKVLQRVNRPITSSEEDEHPESTNPTKSSSPTEEPKVDPSGFVTKKVPKWCKVCRLRTPNPKIADEPEPEVTVSRSDSDGTSPPSGHLNFKIGDANKRRNKTGGPMKSTLKPSITAAEQIKTTTPTPALMTKLIPGNKNNAKTTTTKPSIIPPNKPTPNANVKPILTPVTTRSQQLNGASQISKGTVQPIVTSVPPNPSKKASTKSSNKITPKATKNPQKSSSSSKIEHATEAPVPVTTTMTTTTPFVFDPKCAETGQDCGATKGVCCQAKYDTCGKFFGVADLTCGSFNPEMYKAEKYDEVQERFAAQQYF